MKKRLAVIAAGLAGVVGLMMMPAPGSAGGDNHGDNGKGHTDHGNGNGFGHCKGKGQGHHEDEECPGPSRKHQ